MAVNSFTFNGINSLQYGLYVSGNQTFNSAQKEYEKVSIPGRSGDLLIFNNRYSNVDLNYDAILFNDYEQNSANVRAWLLSSNGYCRLEDTYHPEEFRMAFFAGPIDFDTLLLEAGTTTITFDCKPQRWLKIGEVPVYYKPPVTSEESTLKYYINNPTRFEADPIIKIVRKEEENWGTNGRTFSINNKNITILPSDPLNPSISNTWLSIVFDCDINDCYSDDSNAKVNVNNFIKLESGWPTLKPGVNEISFDISSEIWIDKLIIIPRWWTL